MQPNRKTIVVWVTTLLDGAEIEAPALTAVQRAKATWALLRGISTLEATERPEDMELPWRLRLFASEVKELAGGAEIATRLDDLADRMDEEGIKPAKDREE
jgi:hypothetical protein